MSIQSQINRLTTAKNDIASAIQAKGVAVPGGSKLDDMPELIAAIQQGDVSVSPLTVAANGTYTAPSGQAYSPVTVAIPYYEGW